MKVMNSISSITPSRRLLLASGILTVALGLSACGSGVSTEDNPQTVAQNVVDYAGPPPSTDDVQSFKINLWDNVKSNNRCGSCHTVGGQSPAFARTDDVNMAYEAANAIVDLTDPANSRMVGKVADGHNCWLDSDAACGEILTTWITAWAGETAAGGGRAIELKPPVIKDPGNSKNFPDDSAAFASTVYPLLTEYCSRCHVSSANSPQSPYFASADVNEAYAAVQSKIDLDNPDDSRLVIRLLNEFHNCWSDCSANGNEMLGAIEALAGGIEPTQIDPSLVVSKALTLYDGVVASGGNRYEANVVGMWEFKTGQGAVAYDTSGVEPALNLNLSGDISWFGGWGIEIKGGKAQGSTSTSKKLHDMIKATGEYSVEAWIVPANVTQEDARIITYSAGDMARNFSLMQRLYTYEHYNRSSISDGNGDPRLATNADDEDLQASLQHVVATYDPVEGRKIYVNGAFTEDMDSAGGGTLNDWDDTFAFVLGNEASNDGQWQGIVRLVAIHNRTMTAEQVAQNFEAGVGEKFLLLFYVGDVVNVPESYIMFEVSQYDNYSYLFNKPVFLSLDPNASPDGIPVEGMLLGINGAEAQVGQVYGNMDETVSAASYTETGQVLSQLGTIVGLQKGPDQDEFFLSFEQLGAFSNVRVEALPLAPAPPPDGDPEPAIGIRTFDEINATIAAITTVSTQQTDVKQTFEIVKQQLPVVENIETFSSAHQVGIAQLAIEYCNALVDDNALRSAYFPGFDFTAAANVAFNGAAQRSLVLNPLITRTLNSNVGSQPDPADTRVHLDSLIDTLTSCGAGCPAGRTATVVKAVCAAAVGSAPMLVQ
jgi:hypothetical protein